MIDEQLFNRFKSLSRDIMNTASVVQNDHDLLIENRHITFDDAKENYWEFMKRMGEHKNELDSLLSDVTLRLSTVIQKLDTVDNM